MWAALLPHLLLYLALTGSCSAKRGFAEELVIQEVGEGSFLAQAQFEASAASCSPETGLFPASLKRLVLANGVRDLQLTVSRGRLPPPGNFTSQHMAPPAGLVLRVEFASWMANTEAAFKNLAEGLGPLLSIPLARLPEDGVLTAPQVGWFADRAVSRAQVYAALPRETCCSADLAAWVRLLPCRHHAGLAALLDPQSLAAAPYYALQLRLASEGRACQGRGEQCGAVSKPGCRGFARVSMQQRVEMLLPGKQAAAAGDKGQPGEAAQRVAELVQSVLGRPLAPACQASDSSTIRLPASLLPSVSELAWAPLVAPEAQPGGGLECSHLSGGSHQLGTPSWAVCRLGQGQQLHSMAAAVQLQAALGGTAEAPAATAGSAAAAGTLEVEGAASAASSRDDALVSTRSELHVVRHMVPHGLTEGELVLSIKASDSTTTSSSGSHGRGDSSGSSRDSPSSQLLHIFQAVPWQLPLQLHTLRLTLDGQDVQLAGHPPVVWHRLLPAGGPSVPAVIELLLKLPSGAGPHRVVLTVKFRKRLLSVFQHAPDASRGVDIPAAEVALIPSACADLPSEFPAQATEPRVGSSSSSSAAHCNFQPNRAPAHYGVTSGGSSDGGSGDNGAACTPQLAYSSGHLVPLPIPDLSMAFNVCCFTSTVLAVYFGGVLNTLVRPADEGASKAAGPSVLKRKLRRLVVLGALGLGLALYLDKDLQRQAQLFLEQVVLGEGFAAGEL